jgi:hypothetical protein
VQALCLLVLGPFLELQLQLLCCALHCSRQLWQQSQLLPGLGGGVCLVAGCVCTVGVDACYGCQVQEGLHDAVGLCWSIKLPPPQIWHVV